MFEIDQNLPMASPSTHGADQLRSVIKQALASKTKNVYVSKAWMASAFPYLKQLAVPGRVFEDKEGNHSVKLGRFNFMIHVDERLPQYQFRVE